MMHGQNRDLCMYLSVLYGSRPVWILTCMDSTCIDCHLLFMDFCLPTSLSALVTTAASLKGHDMATFDMATFDMVIRHAPAPRYRGRYTTPDVLCHRAPPRHVHDMVSHRVIFIKAFVLFQRLHLVSIVCDVSVGRKGGLSGACYSARKHRPVGLRPAASLFSLCILPFSWCTWLFLGRSSSRAIPGVSRVAAATCDSFLPRNRAETDWEW